MELYYYNQTESDYQLEEIDKEDVFIKKYRLNYRSPYKTGIAINDTVHAELFVNKDSGKKNISDSKSKNFLILVHGFSTGKKKLNNYYHFISKMNENNISCGFINMPFHLNRTPLGEKSGERLIYYNDIETLQFFHQCVVDIRKLTDILLKNFSFKKIYICGVSLGSMVSLITMANDNRISKGVFLIGGGNWEEIHWSGILKFILKGDCTNKNEKRREACMESYSNFPVFLEEFKKIENRKINIDLRDMPDLKKETKKMCFLCDPLTFAHKISPEKVFMINSRFDFYFPKTSSLQLWEELGRPKIYWLNKLHSSNILTDKKVIKEIKNFLIGISCL